MKKFQRQMKNGKSLGSMFGDVASKAAKWGAGIATAAITAASAIGGMAINTTQEINKATDSFIVATGSATEQTEEYNEVLANIYKNNYGEDFQDIADSMAQVKTQIGEINNADLQNVTENALALRDTFGFEVNESVRAAKMMMDQWGISSEEAYNLIAQGAQAGLDKNGDLLDSINEYSVHFQQIGLDATDMFNIFKTGAENGAFSIDKIGDAVKEMGIRMKDGSATEALQSMNLDAQELEKAFAKGGDEGFKAFFKISDSLASIQDPLKQNQAGVALFGTMWEDLGAEAVLAMTQSGDEFNQMRNTMEEIKDIKYDNLSDMFEGLKRNVEMLVLPLGNALMPILQDVIQFAMDNMPIIEGIFEDMTPVITELFSELLPPLMNLMESIMPVLFDLLEQIVPFASQLFQTILPVIVDLLNMLLPPAIQIVQAILPILIQLLDPILQLLQPVIQLLQPLIDLCMTLLEPLLELINMILPPLVSVFSTIIQAILPELQNGITIVASIIGGAFVEAFNSIKTHVELVKSNFQNIIDFIRNVFTGNWRGAWENIKNIFSNIVAGLGNIFKAPLNFIIGGINGFIRGINKIQIPDWVPSVGGKGFHINEIPKLKVGMDYVPEDDFPALLHEGEAVLTKEENAEYRQKMLRDINNNNSENKTDVVIYIQKLIDILLAYFPKFKDSMERDFVFEDGTLAARLTPYIDEDLSDEETKRRRRN